MFKTVDVDCVVNFLLLHPRRPQPTSLLLDPVLCFISQMANGYSGFNFSDISMSGQHNGFQPRLDTLSNLANFTSGSHGINDGAEIRQLLAHISALERDLAVQKCAILFSHAYMY